MPETMSPREKVVHKQPCDHCQRMTVVDPAPILAALASSGDHAELARVAAYVDHAREINQGAILVSTGDLEALIAEVAALRANEKAALKECAEWARKAGEAIGKLETSEAAGIVEGWQDRATEAERKLAEAVGLLRDLASWFDGSAYNGAWVIRSGDLGVDDAICAARAFLSKEAERG